MNLFNLEQKMCGIKYSSLKGLTQQPDWDIFVSQIFCAIDLRDTI